MKYQQCYEGDWKEPVSRGYKMAYCDCGLVHTINFRIVGGHTQFQVFRDNHAGVRRGRVGKERLQRLAELL